MSDLEKGRPGSADRFYPAEGQHSNGNSAPTAQATATAGDRNGWIVALVLAIAALIMAVTMIATLRGISNEVENVRGLIENSAQAASQSAVNAAVAAERADKAERSAALNREYAVQVVGQLNRMGYPVISPGEGEHPPALPADYEKLDAFIAGKQESKP